jgi:F420-non-reducing hydrogenase iron-sulfur subunit
VKRVKKVKGMLHMLRINPERLEFYNLSAAQGPRWAEICTEFTKKINAMGPSPIWFALQKKKESAATEKQAA